MTADTCSNVPQGTPAGCCRGPAEPAPESARDILDSRYAKGEITTEQYQAMRQRIASEPGPFREEVQS